MHTSNFPYFSSGYKLPFEKVSKWWPSDTEERFNNNLKKNYDKLKSYGWLDRKITYNLNEYGFRTEEFTNEVDALFLGCSFTFGTGLENELIWVSKVKNELNLSGHNLGVSGGSFDTIFRLTYYWIDKLKPKYIFLLGTGKTRREYFNDKKIIKMLPTGNFSQDSNISRLNWSEKIISDVYQNEILSEDSSELNYQKNLLAIKSLCNMHNCKLIEIDMEKLEKNTFEESARDLMHYGEDFHDFIKNKFVEKFDGE